MLEILNPKRQWAAPTAVRAANAGGPTIIDARPTQRRRAALSSAPKLACNDLHLRKRWFYNGLPTGMILLIALQTWITGQAYILSGAGQVASLLLLWVVVVFIYCFVYLARVGPSWICVISPDCFVCNGRNIAVDRRVRCTISIKYFFHLFLCEICFWWVLNNVAAMMPAMFFCSAGASLWGANFRQDCRF